MSVEEDINKTISIGGEETTIFEIMSLFRSEGSCEPTVREALVRMANQQQAAAASKTATGSALLRNQADMLRLRKEIDPDAPNPVVVEREVCVEHCSWCNQDYDFFTQSIHCPHASKPPIWGRGLEPLACIQNAVNGWFAALPLGDITQEVKDDLVKRVYQAVAFQPTGHFGDDANAYRALARKATETIAD